MLILGLNMFHADASVAIVDDGKVLFAIAEERLNRKKHYGGFPALAVKACLDAAGARISDVDHVAVGQDSDANLAQKVQYALSNPSKILNFIKLRRRKEAMPRLLALRLYRAAVLSMDWEHIADAEANDDKNPDGKWDAQAVRLSVRRWARELGVPLPERRVGRPPKS